MTEIEAAESLLRLHRLTQRRFDQPVFGDPAMVMLLELLVAARDGRALSESGLSGAAGLPATTGHRFVGVLEQQGFVRKSTDREKDDDREVCLTAEGDARVGQLLRDWH